MTYSKQFRQKVLAYKDKFGLTFDDTGKHFDISARSLYRWSNQIEPCETRDKPSTKVDMEQLEKDVNQFPDDYQWERAKRLNVGQPAIHYALKRLKITVKKNSTAS